MLTHWLFIVYYISVLICSMQTLPVERGAHIHKDHELHRRVTRGLPTKLRYLLQKATLLYQAKNYQVYGIKGGTNQALKDWKELKPRNVADFGLTKLGDVGDRTVMLDMDDGKTILNILTSKIAPDGNIVRIVSRVKYSDNLPDMPFPVSKN